MSTKTKKCTMEQCEKAVKLKKAGEKYPAICKLTGLSYGHAWNAIRYSEVAASKLFVPEAQRTGQKVAQMRDSGNMSWGEILIRFDVHPAKPGKYTEGAVRRMYKEATGISSQGLRKGHGGRFLLGKQGERLYRGGDRKRAGIAIEAGLTRQQIAERAAALDEKTTKLTVGSRAAKAVVVAKKVGAAKSTSTPVKKAAKQAPTKKSVRAAKKASAGKVANERSEARMAAANAS